MDNQDIRIAQILADGDVDNEEMQEKSSETIAQAVMATGAGRKCAFSASASRNGAQLRARSTLATCPVA